MESPLAHAVRTDAPDRYGRLLAICYVGGQDLNELLVREGWALDYRKYSTDYLRAESAATRAGAGIWRSSSCPGSGAPLAADLVRARRGTARRNGLAGSGPARD
jgi:endonuclease YncB( thermonuclease family)